MPLTRVAHHHIEQVLAALEGQRSFTSKDSLRESWMRSVSAYGIDPASERQPQLLTSREIRDLQEPAAQMLEVAQVELDHLYKLVQPANYVILLCNSDGIVIDHRGDEAQAAQFRHWGTWLGGVWGEGVEGTNGIGTALVEQRPVTVHRTQHFKARHIDLSCSGAPIFGTNGALAGVLDVSSIDPNLSEHAHALTGALTIATARAIEERVFREEFSHVWVVAVRIPEDLGATMLLAVDQDQHIVGGDRAARAVLAQWGHSIDGRIALPTVFERSDGLLRKREREDIWTQVRPLGTENAWPAIVSAPRPASIQRLHTDMADLHRRPRLDMFLTGRWTPHIAPPERGGLTPATLRRVRQYVDDHIHQNIDLESLAATAGLSTFHFARAFKQSEGTTPQDYVLERRIEKARELLRQPDLSLSDISSTVGFADQSHFTRRFRDVVGITPGQFRRQQA